MTLLKERFITSTEDPLITQSAELSVTEWYEYDISEEGTATLSAVWEMDEKTNHMVMRWENGRETTGRD